MDFLSANIFLKAAFLSYVPDANDEPTAVWAMEFRDRPAFCDHQPYQETEIVMQERREGREGKFFCHW
jgi:hypothetical protein